MMTKTVHFGVGLILITAGIAKLLAPETAGWLETYGLRIPVVCLEIAIGVPLLLGAGGRALWLAVSILFAGFSVISLSMAIGGTKNCGCFGNLHTSPWLIFGLDILISISLYFAGPIQNVSRHKIIIAGFSSVMAMILIATLQLIYIKSPQSSDLNSHKNSRLPATTQSSIELAPQVRVPVELGQVDTVTAELGKVKANSVSRIAVTFNNSTSENIAIQMDNIECPCIRVLSEYPSIPSGEKREWILEIHAPDVEVEYTKSVRWRTNASAGNLISLKINANVKLKLE